MIHWEGLIRDARIVQLEGMVHWKGLDALVVQLEGIVHWRVGLSHSFIDLNQFTLALVSCNPAV